MPGKCYFNNMWLINPAYKDWIEKIPTQVGSARCKACGKIIVVTSMGEAALKSHASSQKHIDNVKAENTFKQTQASGLLASGFSKNIVVETSKVKPVNVSDIASCTAGNDVLKSEIFWVLRTVSTHSSYFSNEDISDMFKVMFPDSQIAKKFSCGRDKSSYMVNHGLAPYFRSELRDKVKRSDGYVLLFDESLNKQLHQKQCDIHVRFWEPEKQMVQTHFLTSEFLGHATASNLFDVLYPIIQELGTRKLLQISMDGPNVNWKTLDLINAEIGRTHTGLSLLATGSCGLHTVHNAFRQGCVASGWNLEELISDIYYYFKDSPARIEDLHVSSGISEIPPKFCKHRWLENVKVVEKVLSLIPSLKLYVNSVQKPSTLKSFKSLKEVATSSIFLVRAQFFLSVANEVQPFLTEFQGDAPLLPLLSDSIFKLIRGTLDRFVSPDHMKAIMKVSHLENLDLTNTRHLKEPSKIEVGFVTKKVIGELKKEKKITEKEILCFQLECRSFLNALVAKLMNKSPVIYSLVRNMSCLNPALMLKNVNASVTRFKSLLTSLEESGRQDSRHCDAIIKSFKQFLEDCLRSDSLKFSRTDDRLDMLYHSLLTNNKDYEILWPVIKLVLTLSHGQAEVERGFSVNKEAITDNQSQLSLTSRRIVLDAIKACGGVDKCTITKEMLSYAANARHRYRLYLEEKAEKERQSKKRKMEDSAIKDLMNKKARLSEAIIELHKLATEKAKKAETDKSFSLLTASNILRESAATKEKELEALEGEIKEKKSQVQ